VTGRRAQIRPRMDLASEVAAAALARWCREGGSCTPPVPVEQIIEAMGFLVVRLFDVPDEIAGLVSVKERLIGVNARHHPHRQRFTLGHELGHILLGHPPEGRCSPDRVAAFNREADRCASELLMPEHLLRPLLPDICNPSHLARIFDVSPEAIAVRLEELAVRGRAGDAD